MGILFLILKIIGILLAALVLLATAAVAVPVRYRASLKAQGSIEGDAVFHWVFHAVNLQLWYGEEGLSWKCRILGIPIFRQKKKGVLGSGKADGVLREQEKKREEGEDPSVSDGLEPSKEQAKKRVAESIRKQQAEIIAYQRGQDESPQHAEPEEEEHASGRAGSVQEEQASEGAEPVQEEQASEGAEPGQEEQASEGTGQGQENGKLHGFRRIFSFFTGMPGRFQKLKSMAAGGKARFDDLKARFLNIKKLLLDETNQKAFLHILQELKILLRHFSPRKASGDVAFSAGDPALTGKALGMLSLFPFWAKYQVAVAPDFVEESFYIRGKVVVKGYIRIWHLLPSGIRLIKDKNIHRLIAAMRR